MPSDVDADQLIAQAIQNIDYIQESSLNGFTSERSYPARSKSPSEIQQRLDAAESVANEIRSISNARVQLCAALSRISGDAFDIAKAAVAPLVTLTLSGIIKIPIEPFTIALIAIVIGRMGVAAICVEFDK